MFTVLKQKSCTASNLSLTDDTFLYLAGVLRKSSDHKADGVPLLLLQSVRMLHSLNLLLDLEDGYFHGRTDCGEPDPPLAERQFNKMWHLEQSGDFCSAVA